MATEKSYLATLIKLLPTGKAWNAAPDTKLYTFLSAFTPELLRVDQRIDDLIREMSPETAIETFEDWEIEFGTPFDCGGLSGTLEERRQDVIAKMVSLGGQSEEYFLSFFDPSDGAVTITYPPVTAVVGTPVGGPMDYPNLFTWIINIPSGDLDYFEAGDVAGDPLVIGAHTTKRCLIEKYKPAHTHILFTYGV